MKFHIFAWFYNDLLTFVELISCYVKYHLNSMHHLIMKHSMFFSPNAELFSMMMGLGAKSLIFTLLSPMGLRTIFCIIKIYFQRIVLVAPRTKTFRRNSIWIGYPEGEEMIDVHQVFIDLFVCAGYCARCKDTVKCRNHTCTR